MNFKMLCRSFEARTKPYQIKQQNQNRPRNDREEANFNILSPDAHTHVRSLFHSPLTNFVRRGGDNKLDVAFFNFSDWTALLLNANVGKLRTIKRLCAIL